MPTLRIFLLGGYRATLDNVVVSGFRSLRTQALLAYLAMQGRGVRRTELVDLMWSDYPPRAGLVNLRASLCNLHRLLDGNILIERQEVGLACCWCDALVVGTRTTGLPFLPGFEGIDSPHFQDWTRRLRNLPPIPVAASRSLDIVQNALIMLASLGYEETALAALKHLAEWMAQAKHPREERAIDQSILTLAARYYDDAYKDSPEPPASDIDRLPTSAQEAPV